MAIINGLSPRTLRIEQHGQVFRIIDQNNQIYCETKDKDVADEIVGSRNNGKQRSKWYVEIQKPVTVVYKIDAATQAEAIAKVLYDHEQDKKWNRAQWQCRDEDEESFRLVQEHEYESYRRWKEGWKP